ncbi:MAG TPA: response regulator [Steroidobacteraceae bacterium]|nr:response regulator [Steroidobacteraceae bacterium]
MNGQSVIAVHVLLVEDHPRLRKILQFALESDGFRVTAVESADAAVALLENGVTVDILLSDIRMPGSMDGLQLAHWVRERHAGTGVLLQTGFSDLDTGDFPMLRKPYPPEELSARLRAVVADRGKQVGA